MGKKAKWKLTYLIINFALVLALAGNASATYPTGYQWVGGDSNLWSTATNWDSGVVPNITHGANIDVADANCVISAGIDACCASLDVSLLNAPCTLRMTGGTLTLNGINNFGVGGYYAGYPGGGIGTFILSGGTVELPTSSRLWIGQGANYAGTSPDTWIPTSGTFIMTGGDVNVGCKLELGKNQDCTGYMRMDSGTLRIGFDSTNNDFEIGKYGYATFEMYGGDVNIYDALILWGAGTLNGEPSTGSSVVHLYGGYIHCDNVFMGDSNALIDMNQCTIKIDSADQFDLIQKYIANGQIIGYQGDGSVTATQPFPGSTAILVAAAPPDPNQAQHPSPRKYATVDWTPAGPTLSWTPAIALSSPKHDVYFGTNFDDVNNATRDVNLGVLISKAQVPSSIAFPTPLPVLTQTYYWRIDEINDSDANVWKKGNVWWFTMADNEGVENFNEYANSTALRNVWTLSGSSTIDVNTSIAEDGNSMKYHYTHSNATEAYANTTGANKLQVDINDWTVASLKAITLYFYGDPCNAGDVNMYVALRSCDNNLAVVYYSTPADLKVPAWHEWGIKLSDFKKPSNVNDVNLANIAKVYIGFGNRGSSPASDGNVYFDNIRLYPTRCRPSTTAAGDIDKDCFVNYSDLRIMATDWLKGDAYRKGSDGVLMNGASWVNDGTRGKCLSLDGVDDWVNLDDNDFSNFHNKTISFWVKVGAYPASTTYLFYFSDSNGTTPYRIYFLTHGSPESRYRVINSYTGDLPTGQVWQMLTLVLEDTPDGLCTAHVWKNATHYDAFDLIGQRRHSGAAVGVNIGSTDDGGGANAKMLIDDFRVYDYALSGQEVINLYYATLGGYSGYPLPDANMMLYYDFNDTSGTIAHNVSNYVYYHPLLSAAEIYSGEAPGSKVINFRDFAVLANDWLKEQMWP